MAGGPTAQGAHINPIASPTIPSGGSAVAVNPSTDHRYVVVGNSVIVIDESTNVVVATVPVGAAPASIVVNPNTGRIYVAHRLDGTVSVIDGVTNSVVATVPVGFGPVDIAVNPNTDRIYVALAGASQVVVIDGATNDIVNFFSGVGGDAVAVNPTTNRIYVVKSIGGDDEVIVLDGASNAFIETIPIISAGIVGGPNSVAVNPNTNMIYVTVRGVQVPPFVRFEGFVHVIDGGTGAVVDSIFVGVSAPGTAVVDVAVNPVTNRIYVDSGGKLTVIDGANNALVANISVFPVNDHDSIGVNAPDDRVYVAGFPNFSVIENDSDGDGTGDSVDNCPTVSNPGQENDVRPATPDGDACEDFDSDGFRDTEDNCPDEANPGQEDSDGDGEGDACDTCPTIPNATQTDCLIGGFVAFRGDTDAQSEVAASRSGSPLPLTAFVAIGVLLLGAGGLYAVRMRRG